MSGFLYESDAKFSWYITIIFGIFLLVFGYDLVISLQESYSFLLLTIVAAIYGIGSLVILIGILGIYLIKRYGMKGDIILRWSIIVVLVFVPIIFFFFIPGTTFIGIILSIISLFLIIRLIFDIKKISNLNYPTKDKFAILRLILNIVLMILGIVFIPFSIAVNELILRYLPLIYRIGSYGIAFLITGVLLILINVFSVYRIYKAQKEKEVKSKKRRKDSIWYRIDI